MKRIGQSPAHQHPAPFLIRKFTGTAGVKKLILGRHDPSQNGQTDGSAVKMARKGQIRPPGRIFLKKHRRMGQENGKPFFI